MAYMATQFGILARLTWWEYSWDIMEPVTYFITYGTAMAMYAYFVLTRQVRHKSTVIVRVAIKKKMWGQKYQILSIEFILSIRYSYLILRYYVETVCSTLWSSILDVPEKQIWGF